MKIKYSEALQVYQDLGLGSFTKGNKNQDTVFSAVTRLLKEFDIKVKPETLKNSASV